jgi:hypothetical protein
MAEKKLYFKFSDGEDYNNIILELSGCVEWINTDMKSANEGDDREFTLVPVWMTEEEFSNLPEHE